MLQLIVKPFSKPSCNVFETVSLTILVFIAMMNLLKAAYFQSGEIPDTTADDIFKIYDWIEALLLGIIPLCIVGVVAIGILARLLAWPIQYSQKWAEDTRKSPQHPNNMKHLQPKKTYTGHNNEAYDRRAEDHNMHHRHHEHRHNRRSRHNSELRNNDGYEKDNQNANPQFSTNRYYDKYLDSSREYYNNAFQMHASQYHPNYQHGYPLAYPAGYELGHREKGVPW